VVDVLDPESGWVVGSIRLGGVGNDPVNIVFGDHEMWIVGKGGVWQVSNIQDILGKEL
jgi:gluconolactonase